MPQESFQNGYALIVGVGADLPTTVKDASALQAVLTDPSRAGYAQENVILLTEKAATRDGILTAFDELAAKAKADGQATVMVYYSGHGGRWRVAGKPDRYFLVPYGFDRQAVDATAIAGAEFTAKIEALPAGKLVVLLDCCHAGGLPLTKAEGDAFIKSPVPPELVAALAQGSGRVIVASSRDDEYSYIGNNYSVFTECLLEAMAGRGTQAQDGYARILQVLTYLFQEVPGRANNGPQHPYVNEIKALNDNFALCYYAGGSKSIPGAAPAARISSSAVIRKQQMAGLEKAIELLTKKLDLLTSAHAIETNPAVKFQLEQQILEAQSDIENNLARIELLEAKG